MSWFEYGNLTGRKRNLRKGVWLRVRSLPKLILDEANSYMRKFEIIDWVSVAEMRPDNQVLLEFWCHNPFDIRNNLNGKIRYTVFHLLVKEDPKWVCEGDLGRGYKE